MLRIQRAIREQWKRSRSDATMSSAITTTTEATIIIYTYPIYTRASGFKNRHISYPRSHCQSNGQLCHNICNVQWYNHYIYNLFYCYNSFNTQYCRYICNVIIVRTYTNVIIYSFILFFYILHVHKWWSKGSAHCCAHSCINILILCLPIFLLTLENLYFFSLGLQIHNSSVYCCHFWATAPFCHLDLFNQVQKRV